MAPWVLQRQESALSNENIRVFPWRWYLTFTFALRSLITICCFRRTTDRRFHYLRNLCTHVVLGLSPTPSTRHHRRTECKARPWTTPGSRAGPWALQGRPHGPRRGGGGDEERRGLGSWNLVRPQSLQDHRQPVSSRFLTRKLDGLCLKCRTDQATYRFIHC